MRDASAGGESGDGAQVEGRHAVEELLRVGRRRVRELWATHDDDVVALAHEVGVRVRMVDDARLLGRAKSAAPQGVIAFTTPLPDLDGDSLLDDPHAFVVALDGVTDPGNLGAVVRAAECAGATGVVVPRHRSASVTPTVAKAAAGAIEHVPIATVAGVPAFLDRVRRHDVWSVGLDERGDTEIFDLDLADRPLVLVLGAEGHGLARLTRERCDVLVRIPMFGRLASLNVSTAAAIACFEIARRRARAAQERDRTAQ